MLMSPIQEKMDYSIVGIDLFLLWANFCICSIPEQSRADIYPQKTFPILTSTMFETEQGLQAQSELVFGKLSRTIADSVGYLPDCCFFACLC